MREHTLSMLSVRVAAVDYASGFFHCGLTQAMFAH
jgi:hypothetical protein